MSPDWTRIRHDFPILDQEVHGHPLIYFDNAATSQKPRQVIDALVRYYERDNANVHRGLHELSNRATDQYETARRKVAAFVNASDEEIIFTRGTTEGINLVAQSWGRANLKAGDVILATEMEHHSNLVPWQMLAAQTGAVLKHIPVTDEGVLDVDQLDSLLTEQVKLLTFVHVSNSLGTINPAKLLIEKAHAVGAKVLLDGAQSAGHMTVDVRSLDCDFYALSGHKMCAPTGIGALYVKQPILANMPPWHGGGEMILRVQFGSSTFKDGPARFEAGTPDISGAIVLGTAIDYLESIGRQAIFDHDAQLTSYALQRMSEIEGLRIFGPMQDRGALVAFSLEGAHPHDLTEFANTQGLALRGGHHCTQPLMRKFKVPSTTRASFYFYNTRDEIDRMIDILLGAKKFFGS
ncbi:MAG: cysteine desulfurase [Verrucomicrobiaceae bacterium]|nr:cysteine desulfurase [Verrucomicrobiaceae bacterium]